MPTEEGYGVGRFCGIGAPLLAVTLQNQEFDSDLQIPRWSLAVFDRSALFEASDHNPRAESKP
jgi:hypothetical protein